MHGKKTEMEWLRNQEDVRKLKGGREDLQSPTKDGVLKTMGSQ